MQDSILKDVLLLTDEFDDIKIAKLTLFQQGSLELKVSVPCLFKGRSFLVDGQLNVLEPEPTEAAAAN